MLLRSAFRPVIHNHAAHPVVHFLRTSLIHGSAERGPSAATGVELTHAFELGFPVALNRAVSVTGAWIKFIRCGRWKAVRLSALFIFEGAWHVVLRTFHRARTFRIAVSVVHGNAGRGRQGTSFVVKVHRTLDGILFTVNRGKNHASIAIHGWHRALLKTWHATEVNLTSSLVKVKSTVKFVVSARGMGGDWTTAMVIRRFGTLAIVRDAEGVRHASVGVIPTCTAKVAFWAVNPL